MLKEPYSENRPLKGKVYFKHGINNVKEKGRITVYYQGVWLNMAAPEGGGGYL